MWFSRYPRVINRSVLVARPEQAYVDWANAVDDDGPRADLAFLRKQPHAYFVEDIELLDEFAQLIDDYWEPIFYEQLDGWMRDPECWPETLTREGFLEWFDCELCTMVWDMPNTRIKRRS